MNHQSMRFRYLFLFCSIITFCDTVLRAKCIQSCKCEATSISYLSVRQLYQLQSPEYFSNNRAIRTHANENGIHGSFEVAVLGSKSTDPDDLARYFFPNCNTCLIVDEELNAAGQEPRDLFSEIFNIITVEGTGADGFRSIICIKPEQTVVGAGFHWRQSLYQWENCGRGIWGAISFPVLRIRNNMNLCETIISTGGGVTENPDILAVRTPVANMTEALNQAAFCYGKISPCALTKTGVADVTLQLGYEWLDYDPCHLESYVGVLIPTGNTPDGVYLFQPIVGQGHHWGALFGNAGGIKIWESCDEYAAFRMEWAAHTQYLFKHCHVRSFDLRNKPWSRYIEVYENQQQALDAEADLTSGPFSTSYGINVFTQPMEVTPGFSTNMTTAFVFNYCACSAEVGYNLYARRGECVKLACKFPSTIAIRNRFGLGAQNPVRDMTGNVILEDVDPLTYPTITPENYNLNIITLDDINLNSAAQPSMISHTFYGALGYDLCICEVPFFATAGASYEFSNSNNAVVSRWVAWGKLGVSF